jgi:uncharacterized protein
MPEKRLLQRLVPEQSFPTYSYVPGRFPHPVTDPHGHSFGAKPERPKPLDPEQWRQCRLYLYGIDLFNHGYYWEAHEAWESLWHACGRSGRTGCFLKGLIHLAAAGVKVRQGTAQGVTNHARRAAELFRQTTDKTGTGNTRYSGLCLDELIVHAQQMAAAKPSGARDDEKAVPPVFDFVLSPG